ncbi:MAG: VOC family protein [Flavobacteriaceae bacterium]|nr:VOC family protein [Flavobacteriaceae bacterium]MDZ4148239.1 VOC family protein [Flavobacteriaceae bacterium]
MKNPALSFLLLIFTLSANAQDSIPFSATFNHVALAVKDVDRSADFYKNTLHLKEITNRTEKMGRRWLSLGSDKELHLIAATTIRDESNATNEVHFAMAVAGFENFIKSLDAKKIKYFNWEGESHKIKIRADGVKQIYFQDPDGYWIEVNSVE